jgi:recombinational DNA repair protein (RecF pathway)
MTSKDQNTDALVLQRFDQGEADVRLDLLTSQLGRITVFSRGAKYQKSKLRYSLEPYSLINATLIQTRSSGWQLTTASLFHNLYYDFESSERLIFVRLVAMLKRVIPPEELNDLEQYLINILKHNPSMVANYYLMIAGLLLVQLGYLDEPALAQTLVARDENAQALSETTLENLQSNYDLATLKKSIWQALENSQL